MLRLCQEELGTHLLVKTHELDSLLILQEAEGMFRAGKELAVDIEYVRGTDAERGMQYQVWAARGFHHGKFRGELQVALVQITMLKGPRKGETETFWIITTEVTLTAQQMRELAHRRWSIENHAFRALKEHVDSKHLWVRGKQAAQAFETLMLVLLLSFTLVLAYHAHLDSAELWETRRLRRATVAYLGECWLLSLPSAAGLFSVDG